MLGGNAGSKKTVATAVEGGQGKVLGALLFQAPYCEGGLFAYSKG